MQNAIVRLLIIVLLISVAHPNMYGQDSWYGIESSEWGRVRPEQLSDLLGDRSPRFRNRAGRNALSLAAEYASDPDIIDALAVGLDDIDQPDFLRFTPLHYAVRSNPNTTVTKRLLELGADPNVRAFPYEDSPNMSKPLIHLMVETVFPDNLHAILDDQRFALEQSECVPVITNAIDHLHDAAVLPKLLDLCPNVGPDVLDKALYSAVAIESPEGIVRLLVERGARPQAPISRTSTEHRFIGPYYLKTPFNLAIKNNSPLVSVFIELGADVNAGTRGWSDNYEIVPLMYALEAGNPEIVRRLIEAGADVEKGETIIRSQGRVEVISTPLMEAARRNSIENVRVLIDAGANVDATNVAGANALMFAARYAEDPSITRTVLDATANANVRMNNNGPSALMWAAFKAPPETILMLLDAGADHLVVTNTVTVWDIVQLNDRAIETTAYVRLDTGAVPMLRRDVVAYLRRWSPVSSNYEPDDGRR